MYSVTSPASTGKNPCVKHLKTFLNLKIFLLPSKNSGRFINRKISKNFQIWAVFCVRKELVNQLKCNLTFMCFIKLVISGSWKFSNLIFCWLIYIATGSVSWLVCCLIIGRGWTIGCRAPLFRQVSTIFNVLIWERNKELHFMCAYMLWTRSGLNF